MGADEVKLTNASIKLPLKSFGDFEAKNEKEENLKEAQEELKDDLRNKVTGKKYDSPLNVVEGKDGFLNVGENAESVEVKKGKVIYPQHAKAEMEMKGMDTSALVPKVNSGERENMANGRQYFEAEVEDMTMEMPSPTNPAPSHALSGNSGVLDTSLAEEIEIDEGKLKVKPWKDYVADVRPKVNESIEKKSKLSPQQEKLVEQAQQLTEELAQTKTQVMVGSDGKKFVKITPQSGVPQNMSVNDV